LEETGGNDADERWETLQRWCLYHDYVETWKERLHTRDLFWIVELLKISNDLPAVRMLYGRTYVENIWFRRELLWETKRRSQDSGCTHDKRVIFRSVHADMQKTSVSEGASICD
jgi:hypothetical protein